MIRLTREAIKSSYQVHLQHSRANIERRLEAARARGDEKLVEMLKAENDDIYMRRSN